MESRICNVWFKFVFIWHCLAIASATTRNKQIVDEGDRVEFECVVKGTPSPKVSWSRLEGPLPPTAITDESFLTIPEARPEDSGTYLCSATNVAGTAEYSVHLFVQPYPFFGLSRYLLSTQVPLVTTFINAVPAIASATGGRKQNVDEGDRAEIACVARGTPRPKVSWSRLEGPLPPTAITEESFLIIPEARPEDSGTYLCSATNVAGTVESSIQLFVQPYPFFGLSRYLLSTQVPHVNEFINAKDMKVRLVNGTSEAGRLEIFFREEWSTVCDMGFGSKQAMVACRMLGFHRTYTRTVSSARYGAGTGPILPLYLVCDGTETSLAQCTHIPSWKGYCDHMMDIGVMCNTTEEMPARLAKGTAMAGRLEIFFDGEWSTVCERGFGKEEALVACRMLGFNSTSAAAVSSARYGEGSGRILLDFFWCLGTESSLTQCTHSGLYKYGCGHSEDVGVVCITSEDMTARLVNGTAEAGRLEIFFNGEWSTVCEWGFEKEDALVACRMLGFNSSEATAVSSVRYGAGSDRILFDNLGCQGTETSLAQCQHGPYYSQYCGHRHDVGVICNAGGQMTARLVKGTWEAGRLEIFFNGEWSTVCGQGFGREDALVACRMLGFNGTEAAAVGSARYGSGTGTILFENLECSGTETSLAQCQHGTYYSRSCNHHQDVGVICNVERQAKARLVNGTSKAGRLEIFVGGEWSTVCDNNFGKEDALVACRMLGFNSTAAVAVSSGRYGQGSGRILLDDLGCLGTESSLTQCPHEGLYKHNCGHFEDVGVICITSEEMTARLVNGTAEAGRLEIFFNGEWNTVCERGFGAEDALVVCRMLGFNSISATPVGSVRYGAGTGAILFDNLGCQGTETSLAECQHRADNGRLCSHQQDVGVICTMAEEMSARLVNGTAEAGRLEILYNGEWSTVCERGFGKEDALVACRMLGFNSTEAEPVSSARYGAGSGSILFDNLGCRGTESSLAECQHGPYYNSSCSHQQDVGVICNIDQTKARLVNGTSQAGRLEIFFNGEWSTVCQDKFSKEDALVACRMLGFNSTAAVAVSSGRYGQGTGQILLDDVECRGNESSLTQCPHNGLYKLDCVHSQDVGVVCITSEVMTARLVNGTAEAGRLEIFFNGEWSTVCELGFGRKDALVACRMMGFNGTESMPVSSARFGKGSGRVLLQNALCRGTETSLAECQSGLYYPRSCSHKRDVGVICNADQIKARLVNGTSQAGRLELFFSGEWSTVCSYNFGKEEALVACRMLGFNSTSAAAVSSRKYGQGSGRILLDDLGCLGTESSLTQCPHNGLYRHNCGHFEDVGVVCITSKDMTARLVNGTAEAGRLEIFFNGEWNTVCERGFGKEDALVACRTLGFNSSEATAVSSVRYGAGSDTILFDKLRCRGTETSLAQCKHGPYYSHSCGHQQDVGVICNAAGQMTARLVNGTSEAGRLEIFFNGEWSTLCERGFGRKDALIACRMLGFNGTEAASVGSARYGSGTGTILLENLKCSGTETSLTQCQHGTYYSRSCNHQQDVGVICDIDRQTKARLVNGTSTAGRMEIFVGGEWSTVCEDHFVKENALVACRMLGFNSTAAVAVSAGRYGQGSGRILLDDVVCRGTESSLTQCTHNGFYKHNCGHSQDVGVICFKSEEMKARLVNGTLEAGRLEIFVNGEWNTVCKWGFGKEDALVACRMLGFNSIRATPVSSVRYGAGTGAILFDNLACEGTETSLAECEHEPYYSLSCTHQQDVGVICTMGTTTAPTLTLGGQVSNYTVSVSNYVDIRCTAGAGNGQPLKLFKVTSNGTQPLKTSEASVLLFRLENTACEDAGTYICRAKNSTDKKNTASAQLHVLCSPQLACGNIIDPVQATEGSEGQVSFEVTAHPVPTLASFAYRTSYSEEQPVRSGLLSGSCEKHVLAAHLAVCRLDITNPAVTDLGVYNVKVRNSLGTTNVTFTLNVIACTDLLTVCWRYTRQCQESWMREGCRKTCSACTAVTSPGDIERKVHGVGETATRTGQCGNYTLRKESSDLGVKAGAAEESVISDRDRLDMPETDFIKLLLRTRLAEIAGKRDELASQSREIKSKSLSQLNQMETDSKHPPVN